MENKIEDVIIYKHVLRLLSSPDSQVCSCSSPRARAPFSNSGWKSNLLVTASSTGFSKAKRETNWVRNNTREAWEGDDENERRAFLKNLLKYPSEWSRATGDEAFVRSLVESRKWTLLLWFLLSSLDFNRSLRSGPLSLPENGFLSRTGACIIDPTISIICESRKRGCGGKQQKALFFCWSLSSF